MFKRRRTTPRAEPVASRRWFLSAGGLGFAGLIASGMQLGASRGEPARGCCPQRIAAPAGTAPVSRTALAEGKSQAQLVASSSALIGRANEAVLELAAAIVDIPLRNETLDLLRNPAPTYMLRSPTTADRQAVRQELLAAGLIPPVTRVDGIFPPVDDPRVAAQPFWSAPGGSYSGHHSYPGGLAMHEWFNTITAQQYQGTYATVYNLAGSAGSTDPINTDINLAAPLWHDVQKTTVFQWNADGSELTEQVIADTGAHHPLGGAEAIVRGMPAALVIALLSAHDAPTTVKTNADQTGMQRLVNYLRAAAIIARIDPVEAGLLSRSDAGYALAQQPPRIEGFINHFADQDYLLTGDASAEMIARMKVLAAGYGIDPGQQPAQFNLFRNQVFSQISDVRLYGALLSGGIDSVRVIIDAEVDLGQLSG